MEFVKTELRGESGAGTLMRRSERTLLEEKHERRSTPRHQAIRTTGEQRMMPFTTHGMN